MLFSDRVLVALIAALCFISSAPVFAQKTKAQLSTEIGTTFPDNTSGQITPAGIRAYESDVINSIMPTSPVVAGNLACFNGTTGLLQDCGLAPATVPLTVGVTPINSGTNGNLIYDNVGKFGEIGLNALLDTLSSTRGSIIERGASGWTTISPGSSGLPWVSNGAGADPAYQALGIVGGGTNCTAASGTCLDNITGFSSAGYLKRTGVGTYTLNSQISIADGGTGAGTQAAAAQAVLPAPTRAGDVLYWNGTAWTTLPGNNSGTQFFQENATGVPSWATVSGSGTVTNIVIAAGNGVSVSGTCTITSTGTCTVAVNLSTASNVLAGNVAMTSASTFYDGPSMAQGTTGTWFAAGTVLLTDSTSVTNEYCKLWDGTTVIDSGVTSIGGAGYYSEITLHGILSSPAGNIKISCENVGSTHSSIIANQSGAGKDSTVYGFRIQ